MGHAHGGGAAYGQLALLSGMKIGRDDVLKPEENLWVHGGHKSMDGTMDAMGLFVKIVLCSQEHKIGK